ncbi:hypothetical protein C8R44DRAFT_867156 [Mycena epipterygia]|nr:hypothetical protein C8R44DRAFT_867156 [Mycena epipterygia]
MKGFDYLSPQGMYDAINAYGLPSAIIDLDCTAQTETKCFIRTAHGTTEPIVITGVMKQGGSLSPVKSTLTTSMGHHYLNDLMLSDPDALVITSASAQKADPHLPDDRLQLTVAMTEATDDSYIFACTLKSLRTNSMAYVLEPSQNTLDMLGNCVEFDSITNVTGVSPLTITTCKVTLMTNELDFLRAKVDDQACYKELKAFIDDFTFPKFLCCPPITLLRKIGCLSPSTDILTLPVDLHGLDFPSIARINDGIAVDGLHCDLNHLIPSYRTMARITLAD